MFWFAYDIQSIFQSITSLKLLIRSTPTRPLNNSVNICRLISTNIDFCSVHMGKVKLHSVTQIWKGANSRIYFVLSYFIFLISNVVTCLWFRCKDKKDKRFVDKGACLKKSCSYSSQTNPLWLWKLETL